MVRSSQFYRDERAGGYTYYADGQVETITSHNAHGASVAYTYDDLNRLSTVVDNNLPGQNTTTYTYDSGVPVDRSSSTGWDYASNVVTVATPNRLQSKFTYDTLNRLTGMTTQVASYNYTLGATGNRTQAIESNGRTVNWSYDNIYRLTSETIAGDPSQNNGSVSYGLDPVGNRTSETSSLPGINSGSWPVYNADDQQIPSESYDLNGNVTKTANGNSYTYDSQNHMMTMTAPGKSISMVYDAFGNRVAKTVNGRTTQYLVEDDVNPTGYPQVIEELTGPIGAGVVTRTYTYGLQRISQNLSPSVTGNNAWTPSFYVYDGAGSARQLTNSAGVVTDEYEYDAYGNSFTKQGTTPNNYLYRGEQYDPDLSLYYLRARYYNPATGRFLSRDPEDGKATDPATLHKYLYAGGDPTNRIDPTGRANSIAAPGGAAGEYAGLLAVLFVATQITANNVAHNSSSVASSLHELGENLSCSFHRDACLLSGLAGYNGSVYGSGRCLECYEACIKNDGNWPSRASRTSGSVRCDYWHF